MLAMDGILLIDKPAGFTSHDVVARVRRTLGERRVGHTGTLDPFATGLLVILVGRATRLAQFLSDAEKEYQATIRFGYATDTGDFTGQRLKAREETDASELRSNIDANNIEAAIASLRGEIEQTPPMYSAKKIKGQKLYEMARRGEVIERATVRVNVREFEMMGANGDLLRSNDEGTCELAVRVVCSAGTYIRTLAESVGEFLSVGAHLSELRRTRAGQFRIENAITLDKLQEIAQENAAGFLVSPAAALGHLPAVTLNAEQERRTRNGMGVPAPPGSQWTSQGPVGMRTASGELLAVGFYDEVKQLLHPTVVIATQ
ncbi:MAG: tRNA pseudouridine55 synthase [Blastocatellia bacterium]|jgi:tRNA pseudouridine55 synthase|nr:tRNA pseudouridine55 synthase [Blastocatellia bacterium]